MRTVINFALISIFKVPSNYSVLKKTMENSNVWCKPYATKIKIKKNTYHYGSVHVISIHSSLAQNRLSNQVILVAEGNFPWLCSTVAPPPPAFDSQFPRSRLPSRLCVDEVVIFKFHRVVKFLVFSCDFFCVGTFVVENLRMKLDDHESDERGYYLTSKNNEPKHDQSYYYRNFPVIYDLSEMLIMVSHYFHHYNIPVSPMCPMDSSGCDFLFNPERFMVWICCPSKVSHVQDYYVYQCLFVFCFMELA